MIAFDPRLATLSILGMLNASLDWYEAEGAALATIADTFTALVLGGLVPRAPVRPARARRR